ncbi:MAG TPA: hypothetical protein VK395_07645 [Gemmataceae bacterium]|nr:hypothetical protein [Gemmataceae bacterium]
MPIYDANPWSPACEAPVLRREDNKFEPAENPVEVIRSILAAGPVRVKEFRRLARARGVSLTQLIRVAYQAGARCRKCGPWGPKGYCVWELVGPEYVGLIQRPNRRGYYAHVWIAGREVQVKLSDELEEAQQRLNELRNSSS